MNSKNSNPTTNRTISLLYIYALLSGSLLSIPFYMLYFQHYGVSLTEIGVSFLFFAGVPLLFEVPSGVWADKYSRKNVVIVGELLLVVSFVMWIMSPSAISLYIGNILWGIRNSLYSGTFDAYVYDYLKNNKQEKSYPKIRAKLSSLFPFGIGIAGIIGYFILPAYGIAIVMTSSLVFQLVKIAVLAFLPQAKPQKQLTDSRLFNYVAESFRFVKKFPHVGWVMAYSMFFSGFYYTIAEYLSPLIQDKIPQIAVIGLVVAVGHFMRSAGIALFPRMFDKAELRYRLFPLLIVVIGLAASMVTGYIGVGLLLISQFFGEAFVNQNEVIVQKQIPSAIRATILSVQYFIGGAPIAIILWVFGVVADKSLTHALQFAMMGMGLLWLISLFIISQKEIRKSLS